MDIDSKLIELGFKPRNGTAYNPPTNEEIAELEGLLHAELPEDYKAFVLKYGDSSFSKVIEVRLIEPPPKYISADGRTLFSSFYGSNADGHGLLAFFAVLEGRMPKSVFPFAQDYSGNNYCLGVSGTDRGKVYLWDFEGEPAEEDYTEKNLPVSEDIWYQNLTLVANSFTDFIDRLEIAPDSD